MRAAVIGVGRMGRRHVQAVRELCWDLVGAYDVNPEALRLTHEEQGVPAERLFSDLDRLFSAARPECVIIATTADSHADLTCTAAERGARFILVEKPMAVSLAECDRMLAACARAGTKLAVNHQMRFMPQYTEAKRIMSSEAYGRFASMTVVAGSFGFATNGTHYLEAFRYLSDESAAEVTAWFSAETLPNPRGPQFQDRAGTIRVVTAGGKRLFMEIGADQGYGLHLVLSSRNGMIVVDEITGEMRCAVRKEEHRDMPTTRIALPADRTELQIELAGVIKSTAAVLTALVEDANSVTGEDGRKAVEVLVAAYQSAEAGNVPVRVGPGLDRDRTFPWA